MDENQLQLDLRRLDLEGQDVAVHSSLRSFGKVDGGAQAIIRALCEVCSTVLMPAFCEIGRTNPPPEDRPPCNGWNYEEYQINTSNLIPFDPYTFGPTSGLNSEEMGRIPTEFLLCPDTLRSAHPSVSWSARGPLASWYVADHALNDPNAPLKKLRERQGYVLLLGVGLEACTALHLAEECAGRQAFIRWIQYADGRIRRVREYGCSDGFPNLLPLVGQLAKQISIGSCQAASYPIDALVKTGCQSILAQPTLTLCRRKGPCRCQDAVRGGPRGNA